MQLLEQLQKCIRKDTLIKMCDYKPLTVTTKEHNVEDKLRKTIEQKCGGYVIKNQASQTTGSGKPDLSACIDGRYYGIEVKRAQGSVSTTLNQVNVLRKIALAGGEALWAKSNKVDSYIKFNQSHRFSALSLQTVLPHFEFDNSSDVLKEVKHQLNKKDVVFIKLVNDQYNTNIVKLLVYTKAVL